MAGDTPDLALFNISIDTKLRSRDLVAFGSGMSSRRAREGTGHNVTEQDGQAFRFGLPLKSGPA